MLKKKKEFKSFIPELVESVILVHCHFNDLRKTALWFDTDNPLLGGYKPFRMFLIGRGHKVLAFIKNALDNNERKL